jgi:hypothetical protein
MSTVTGAQPAHLWEDGLPAIRIRFPGHCTNREAECRVVERRVPLVNYGAIRSASSKRTGKDASGSAVGKATVSAKLTLESVVRGESRLRPRGCATRQLEAAGRSMGVFAGGDSVDRWMDLVNTSPARAAAEWLRSHLGGNVKICEAIRSVPGKEGKSFVALQVLVDQPRRQGFLTTDSGRRGQLWVLPNLVAALASYACFRPRGSTVYSALRARARAWLADNGISDLWSASVLPGSVVLGATASRQELLANVAMRSANMDAGAQEAASLEAGYAPELATAPSSFWGIWGALTGEASLLGLPGALVPVTQGARWRGTK